MMNAVKRKSNKKDRDRAGVWNYFGVNGWRKISEDMTFDLGHTRNELKEQKKHNDWRVGIKVEGTPKAKVLRQEKLGKDREKIPGPQVEVEENGSNQDSTREK